MPIIEQLNKINIKNQSMRTYFKSTASNTGSLLNVSFASKLKNDKEEKEGAVFFKIVKQVTWDSDRKKGNFSKGASINVKFTLPEIAGIINSVESLTPFSFFHSFGKESANGTFNFFELQLKEGQKEGTRGYSLKIKKNNEEFKSFLTLNEGLDLAAFLKYARKHIYNGLVSIEKNRFAKLPKPNKEIKESEVKETTDVNPPEVVVEDEDNINW